MSDTEALLAELIDRIEAAYEYMLAYAAQGRLGNEEGATEIEEVLTRLHQSLAALEIVGDLPDIDDAVRQFLGVLLEDRDRAVAAVDLALSRELISSQIIDNLNASLHLRAILTDLFLLDECLKGN